MKFQKLTQAFTLVGSRIEKIVVVRVAEQVIMHFNAHEATTRAGAIAYHTLLSIFPLLLGFVSPFGFFLPRSSVRQAVSTALGNLFPGSAVFIQKTLDSVVAQRGSVGIISLLLLLWSGSNLFGNVRRALNRAWNVPADQKLFLSKSIDLVMLGGCGVLLLLSISTTAITQLLERLGVVSSVINLGGRAVASVLAFGLFLLVYKYVPNTTTYWRWTWPGALLTAIFFQAGAFVFVFYVGRLASYQYVYGSLGSVIIFLFWTYLSALVLILGAELNSELFRLACGINGH